MNSITRFLEQNGLTATLRKALDLVIYALESAAISTYNRFRAEETYAPPTGFARFNQIIIRSLTPTDINDHLERLFAESLPVDPNTIVELGVRGGESTFVFERVARMTDADLVSVDIEDCSGATDYDRWHFVQSDDVEFATDFEEWCADRNVDPNVDVLFVDTSHLYDHTVEEINEWFPHLSDRAAVFFHDTNLTRYYRREDGTIGRGWDNDRGVIRALEDHFDCSFDESELFVTVQRPFIIKHHPCCNGMAVLQKTPTLAE